jgi:hypothetical protein
VRRILDRGWSLRDGAAIGHHRQVREDATVKRSTPTTPQHSESSQPDVPQESKRFAQNVKALMIAKGYLKKNEP